MLKRTIISFSILIVFATFFVGKSFASTNSTGHYYYYGNGNVIVQMTQYWSYNGSTVADLSSGGVCTYHASPGWGIASTGHNFYYTVSNHSAGEYWCNVYFVDPYGNVTFVYPRIDIYASGIWSWR